MRKGAEFVVRLPLAAAAQAPEFVVLDIGMPDMDGDELARWLRDVATTATAVLGAATGFNEKQDRVRLRESGTDYHLVKPVDLKALRSVLSTARRPSEGDKPIAKR